MAYLSRLTTERAAAIIVFMLLFALACRVSLDPDMWWHLRLGEDILARGAPVYADSFSHTYAGALHRNHSWLAQLVMVGFWRLAGHAGLTLYTALLATGGMFFLYRAGCGTIYMRGFVLILGAACAAAFWSPRPQMFTFFFGAALIFLLFDLKRRRRDRLWRLPPLLWLWGNCHGGFVIGFVILAAFWLGEFINHVFRLGEERIAPSTLRKLAGITLLSFAIMPVNPLGLEVFAVPFHTLEIAGLRDYIQEWGAPDFSLAYTRGFIALLLALAGAALASRRRLDATEWILVCGSLTLALIAGRNLPLFALAGAPVAAIHFDALLQRKGWTIAPRSREVPRRLAANLLLIAVVALGAWLRLGFVSDGATVDAALSLNFPVAAVKHLNREALSGKLFNSYNWGGYLIFTARDHPVFIDGRADLYHDFLDEYAAALHADTWRDVFRKWDIKIALIESGSQLALALAADDRWRRGYADAVASVYLRADA